MVYGATPLHWAAWGWRTVSEYQAIRSLVTYKADPNAMDSDGQTPVKWADLQGNDIMVE